MRHDLTKRNLQASIVAVFAVALTTMATMSPLEIKTADDVDSSTKIEESSFNPEEIPANLEYETPKLPAPPKPEEIERDVTSVSKENGWDINTDRYSETTGSPTLGGDQREREISIGFEDPESPKLPRRQEEIIKEESSRMEEKFGRDFKFDQYSSDNGRRRSVTTEDVQGKTVDEDSELRQMLEQLDRDIEAYDASQKN